MKHKSQIILAIATLALAALSCNALTGGGEPPIPDLPTGLPVIPTVSSDFPVPTEELQGNPGDVLFEDDFIPGRGEWGTGTDVDSAVEYVEEALNFQIFSANYSVRTAPNDKDYQNIHMEVTVLNIDSDSETAFGLICYEQFIDESYYYFAVTPGGQYVIAKAILAQEDVYLTNNGQWGDSDLIPKDAASYRIGADCGNGALVLYVDGQEIDSVSDSDYTSGGFSIFAWSGEQPNSVNVSFDDFLMTQLP